LVGEKAFANEIHCIKISQLTEESEAALVPLYNLPEYLKIVKNLSEKELNL